jgi:hypothetical protein
LSDQPIKTHLPSVAQLIISIIGLVSSLFSALALLLLMKLGSSIQSIGGQTDQSVYVLAWLGIILSLAAVPSIVFSIRRLARLPMPANQPRSKLIAASIAFLAIIPLGYLIYTSPDLLSNSFLKVLLSFITVAIPLWWFMELGQNKLPKSSAQRFWGLINFQFFAGMPIVMLAEITLFVLALILGGVWLSNKNYFAPLLMTLQTQIMVDPKDMTSLLDQIIPLLQKPEVLAALFFSLSIVTPLVEEFFKPLALWFFIKRGWSESEGFSAGLVCGAAFALVESVSAVISLPQENWTVLLIARIGTGLLHTLTAGLTGWALASAWKTGNYKRLAVTYLISMSLHGVWNFFALLSGLGTNLDLFANSPLAAFSKSAPWVLGALFVGMLAMLFLMNRKIRSTSTPPPLIPPLPVESMG